MLYLCLLAISIMSILRVSRAFAPIANHGARAAFCTESRLGSRLGAAKGGRSKADRAAGVGRNSDGSKERHRDRDASGIPKAPAFQEFVKPRAGSKSQLLDDIPLSGDTGRRDGSGRPSQNRRASSSGRRDGSWSGGSHNDNQGQQTGECL